MDESIGAAKHGHSELACPDIGEAIAWVCDAFGCTLRLRIADHRAQLNVE